MSRQIRCAIYTRKSTEEGLEQDFNSLDAQREACEAYIRSQRGQGWVALQTGYDDGGLSGGTMNRPALQAMLADIDARRIDLVVVYKVDRLTRSLTDFARMVERFDERGVSFVSVTQQFNTTTSMGRLTLNVLLSFAQFEREVTGERIRDKIAASKKKGMWMGGPPPLGYDVHDRKLVINDEEAETVQTLFRAYLECGTVKALQEESGRRGLITKRRVRADGRQKGGLPFTRGHLYQLLRNPLYIGMVPHKGALYPGQHAAIIDRANFDAVQQRLDNNANHRRSAFNAKEPSLLTGFLWDETGDRLCPTHSNKKGRRYRYYISQRLVHRSEGTADGWRLPAKQIEDAVTQALAGFLRNETGLIGALQLTDADPDYLRRVFRRSAAAAGTLNDRGTLSALLDRVTVSANSIDIRLKRAGLNSTICSGDRVCPDDPLEFAVPISMKRRGVETRLIIHTTNSTLAEIDEKLIALIAQARRWCDQLVAGNTSILEIAQLEKADPSDVGRILQLRYLAPEIVKAIVAGSQPPELTAKRLTRIGKLPLDWNRQRRLLRFNLDS